MSNEVEAAVLDSLLSVWKDVTPWMDAFIHDAGKHFLTRCFPDIVVSDRASVEAGIVNELAFSLVKVAWPGGEHPRAIVDYDPRYPQIVSDSIDRIRARSGDASATLSPDGGSEALKVAMRLNWMLRTRILTSTEELNSAAFRVPIKGSGFVGPLEADVLAGGLLLEIKAGQRSIQARDVRQLLLYASLLSEAGRDLDSVCWVNPRRGEVIRLSAEEISHRVSGRAWYELRSRIVSALGIAVSR